MTTVKFNKKKWQMYFVLFIFLEPPILSLLPQFENLSNAFAILRYVATIFITLKLVKSKKNRKQLSIPYFYLALFYMIFTIIAVIENETIYFTWLLGQLAILGFVEYNLYYLSSAYKKWISCYYYLTLIYLTINSLLMLVIPSGFDKSAVGDNRVWFLGRKNGITLYVVIILMTALILRVFYQKKIRGIFLLVGIVAFLSKSSNAIGAFAIICSFVLMFYVNENFNRKVAFLISGFIIVILAVGTLSFMAIAVLGSNSSGGIFSLIARMFGRDVTFSGRKAIWASALNMIKENPIWGSGNATKFYNVWGNAKTVYSAHNTYLDTAVRFGIPCLIIFVVIIVFLFTAISKGYNKRIRNILLISMLAFIATSMFEAFELNLLTWSLFSICYLSSEAKNI